MAQEIERKYLVDHHKWKALAKPLGELYRQGYLLTDPNKTIRVRIAAEKAYLTIKGLTIGASRPEYEYEIPVKDAQEMLDQFAVSELTKVRYKIDVAGKTWEVDEFLGENKGLIAAEIELQSEDEHFTLPEWISTDVTGDERYYNSNLTIHSFKDW